MSRLSLVIKSLNSVIATTMMLAAIVLYPPITLAQGDENAIPQSGCLAGYHNGTYQGERPVTRYEFATGLNACLNRVNQLLPTNRASLATRTDFEALINRQRELNQQLRELNGRVGN